MVGIFWFFNFWEIKYGNLGCIIYIEIDKIVCVCVCGVCFD